jgi:hypothetical protein
MKKIVVFMLLFVFCFGAAAAGADPGELSEEAARTEGALGQYRPVPVVILGAEPSAVLPVAIAGPAAAVLSVCIVIVTVLLAAGFALCVIFWRWYRGQGVRILGTREETRPGKAGPEQAEPGRWM